MYSIVKATTYDHCQHGLVMEFKQYKSGMYYFDVTKHIKYNTSSDVIYDYLPSYSFIQAVEENKSHYRTHNVKNAERDRAFKSRLQNYLKIFNQEISTNSGQH